MQCPEKKIFTMSTEFASTSKSAILTSRISAKRIIIFLSVFSGIYEGKTQRQNRNIRKMFFSIKGKSDFMVHF